ncbi:MAG: dTDP-4-dehydrorhamnose 3,5-epimerase [Pseudomonadota bacterium]
MKLLNTELEGVALIEPDVFGDGRGFFMESWNRQRYADVGLEMDFVQDNVSFSVCGTLRGLHYQEPHSQGKLVQVLLGEVFDVAVDIRQGSPTFGRWVGVTLSSANRRQFYVPPGFAHGFCVNSGEALFSYKCTDYYHPEAEFGIAWNDPDLDIEWPVKEPLLSAKDRSAPRLSDVPVDRLPAFRAGK